MNSLSVLRAEKSTTRRHWTSPTAHPLKFLHPSSRTLLLKPRHPHRPGPLSFPKWPDHKNLSASLQLWWDIVVRTLRLSFPEWNPMAEPHSPQSSKNRIVTYVEPTTVPTTSSASTVAPSKWKISRSRSCPFFLKKSWKFRHFNWFSFSIRIRWV